MKLIYNPLGFSMEISMNESNVLVIENSRAFEQFILQLNEQIKGNSDFFYTDEEKITLFKKMDIVMSTFDLQISDREVQKKLYEHLVEEVEISSLIDSFTDIHSKLINSLEQLNIYNDFELDYNEEFSVSNMLKSLNVRIKALDGDFCSKFVVYGEIMQRLLQKNCFVLCNCDAYLSEKDYSSLNKWAGYNEITLIFLQNRQLPWQKGFNEYIIDMDLCEIH